MRDNGKRRLAKRNNRPTGNGKATFLNDLPPPSRLLTPKSRRLIRLIQSWLEDESGYDEATWPKLEKALKENRVSIGRRRGG
jgi:hypothetical protein